MLIYQVGGQMTLCFFSASIKEIIATMKLFFLVRKKLMLPIEKYYCARFQRRMLSCLLSVPVQWKILLKRHYIVLLREKNHRYYFTKFVRRKFVSYFNATQRGKNNVIQWFPVL